MQWRENEVKGSVRNLRQGGHTFGKFYVSLKVVCEATYEGNHLLDARLQLLEFNRAFIRAFLWHLSERGHADLEPVWRASRILPLSFADPIDRTASVSD